MAIPINLLYLRPNFSRNTLRMAKSRTLEDPWFECNINCTRENHLRTLQPCLELLARRSLGYLTRVKVSFSSHPDPLGKPFIRATPICLHCTSSAASKHDLKVPKLRRRAEPHCALRRRDSEWAERAQHGDEVTPLIGWINRPGVLLSERGLHADIFISLLFQKRG